MSAEIPAGAMRFNSDSQKLEYWNGSAWFQVHTATPNLASAGDRQPGARGLFGGGGAPSPVNELKNIDYILTEVNKASLYKNCPLIEDLDIFLSEHGFKKSEDFITKIFSLPMYVELEDEQVKQGLTRVAEYVREGKLDAMEVENLTRSIIGKSQVKESNYKIVHQLNTVDQVFESVMKRFELKEILK